jgi:spore cortex formation protein SpoVR/YcgB (stage V sporulation)
LAKVITSFSSAASWGSGLTSLSSRKSCPSAAGHPIVLVEDGNFENKGELLLVHRHEGLDLDPSWTTETLANIARLWSRPANVLTEREGKKVRVRHDGTEARTVDA